MKRTSIRARQLRSRLLQSLQALAIGTVINPRPNQTFLMTEDSSTPPSELVITQPNNQQIQLEEETKVQSNASLITDTPNDDQTLHGSMATGPIQDHPVQDQRESEMIKDEQPALGFDNSFGTTSMVLMNRMFPLDKTQQNRPISREVQHVTSIPFIKSSEETKPIVQPTPLPVTSSSDPIPDIEHITTLLDSIQLVKKGIAQHRLQFDQPTLLFIKDAADTVGNTVLNLGSTQTGLIHNNVIKRGSYLRRKKDPQSRENKSKLIRTVQSVFQLVNPHDLETNLNEESPLPSPVHPKQLIQRLLGRFVHTENNILKQLSSSVPPLKSKYSLLSLISSDPVFSQFSFPLSSPSPEFSTQSSTPNSFVFQTPHPAYLQTRTSPNNISASPDPFTFVKVPSALEQFRALRQTTAGYSTHRRFYSFSQFRDNSLLFDNGQGPFLRGDVTFHRMQTRTGARRDEKIRKQQMGRSPSPSPIEESILSFSAEGSGECAIDVLRKLSFKGLEYSQVQPSYQTITALFSELNRPIKPAIATAFGLFEPLSNQDSDSETESHQTSFLEDALSSIYDQILGDPFTRSLTAFYENVTPEIAQLNREEVARQSSNAADFIFSMHFSVQDRLLHSSGHSLLTEQPRSETDLTHSNQKERSETVEKALLEASQILVSEKLIQPINRMKRNREWQRPSLSSMQALFTKLSLPTETINQISSFYQQQSSTPPELQLQVSMGNAILRRRFGDVMNLNPSFLKNMFGQPLPHPPRTKAQIYTLASRSDIFLFSVHNRSAQVAFTSQNRVYHWKRLRSRIDCQQTVDNLYKEPGVIELREWIQANVQQLKGLLIKKNGSSTVGFVRIVSTHGISVYAQHSFTYSPGALYNRPLTSLSHSVFLSKANFGSLNPNRQIISQTFLTSFFSQLASSTFVARSQSLSGSNAFSLYYLNCIKAVQNAHTAISSHQSQLGSSIKLHDLLTLGPKVTAQDYNHRHDFSRNNYSTGQKSTQLGEEKVQQVLNIMRSELKTCREKNIKSEKDDERNFLKWKQLIFKLFIILVRYEESLPPPDQGEMLAPKQHLSPFVRMLSRFDRDTQNALKLCRLTSEPEYQQIRKVEESSPTVDTDVESYFRSFLKAKMLPEKPMTMDNIDLIRDLTHSLIEAMECERKRYMCSTSLAQIECPTKLRREQIQQPTQFLAILNDARSAKEKNKSDHPIARQFHDPTEVTPQYNQLPLPIQKRALSKFDYPSSEKSIDTITLSQKAHRTSESSPQNRQLLSFGIPQTNRPLSQPPTPVLRLPPPPTTAPTLQSPPTQQSVIPGSLNINDPFVKRATTQSTSPAARYSSPGPNTCLNGPPRAHSPHNTRVSPPPGFSNIPQRPQNNRYHQMPQLQPTSSNTVPPLAQQKRVAPRGSFYRNLSSVGKLSIVKFDPQACQTILEVLTDTYMEFKIIPERTLDDASLMAAFGSIISLHITRSASLPLSVAEYITTYGTNQSSPFFKCLNKLKPIVERAMREGNQFQNQKGPPPPNTKEEPSSKITMSAIRKENAYHHSTQVRPSISLIYRLPQQTLPHRLNYIAPSAYTFEIVQFLDHITSEPFSDLSYLPNIIPIHSSSHWGASFLFFYGLNRDSVQMHQHTNAINHDQALFNPLLESGIHSILEMNMKFKGEVHDHYDPHHQYHETFHNPFLSVQTRRTINQTLLWSIGFDEILIQIINKMECLDHSTLQPGKSRLSTLWKGATSAFNRITSMWGSVPITPSQFEQFFIADQLADKLPLETVHIPVPSSSYSMIRQLLNLLVKFPFDSMSSVVSAVAPDIKNRAESKLKERQIEQEQRLRAIEQSGEKQSVQIPTAILPKHAWINKEFLPLPVWINPGQRAYITLMYRLRQQRGFEADMAYRVFTYLTAFLILKYEETSYARHVDLRTQEVLRKRSYLDRNNQLDYSSNPSLASRPLTQNMIKSEESSGPNTEQGESNLNTDTQIKSSPKVPITVFKHLHLLTEDNYIINPQLITLPFQLSVGSLALMIRMGPFSLYDSSADLRRHLLMSNGVASHYFKTSFLLKKDDPKYKARNEPLTQFTRIPFTFSHPDSPSFDSKMRCRLNNQFRDFVKQQTRKIQHKTTRYLMKPKKGISDQRQPIGEAQQETTAFFDELELIPSPPSAMKRNPLDESDELQKQHTDELKETTESQPATQADSPDENTTNTLMATHFRSLFKVQIVRHHFSRTVQTRLPNLTIPSTDSSLAASSTLFSPPDSLALTFSPPTSPLSPLLSTGVPSQSTQPKPSFSSSLPHITRNPHPSLHLDEELEALFQDSPDFSADDLQSSMIPPSSINFAQVSDNLRPKSPANHQPRILPPPLTPTRVRSVLPPSPSIAFAHPAQLPPDRQSYFRPGIPHSLFTDWISMWGNPDNIVSG
ncbi:hypothetical protein BLNAU_463 [Blattamonas nauphoetae]|uniref:Uncharacterized protein n=1 Tax=Blattamonas nauphoetae TaxID=2049346 RepID=A0ABQ9YLB8_9EUKA|nr:hypothetical protein BLNAU_463 [Blattamonas nauphoetae]